MHIVKVPKNIQHPWYIYDIWFLTRHWSCIHLLNLYHCCLSGLLAHLLRSLQYQTVSRNVIYLMYSIPLFHVPVYFVKLVSRTTSRLTRLLSLYDVAILSTSPVKFLQL